MLYHAQQHFFLTSKDLYFSFSPLTLLSYFSLLFAFFFSHQVKNQEAEVQAMNLLNLKAATVNHQL